MSHKDMRGSLILVNAEHSDCDCQPVVSFDLSDFGVTFKSPLCLVWPAVSSIPSLGVIPIQTLHSFFKCSLAGGVQKCSLLAGTGQSGNKMYCL